MSKAQRYDHGRIGMIPTDCGHWYQASDYAKLEAEAQALREEVAAANDRADTLEHRMMGMMTRHFAEAWRKRDTEKALDGYLSAGIAELERERDAALAEVAALRARVVVPDALISAFTTAESGNGKYQIVMRFGELKAMQEAHNYLARLNGKAVSEASILAAVQAVRDRYPVEIFPAEGTSSDCRAAAMARVVCTAVEKELRALLGEGTES